MLAKQQFFLDLKNDEDFIKYRQNAYKSKEHTHYGVVIAGTTTFVLSGKPTSERLISIYCKETHLEPVF